MTTRRPRPCRVGLAALGLLACIALACERRGALPEDRLAARDAVGRLEFENACGVCHDRSGAGSPGKGPSLRASALVAGAPDVLIRIVLDGVRRTNSADPAYALPMPAWRVLTDRDLAAILSYVRRTFGNGSSAVAADEVARVRGATAGRSRPWTLDELRLVATRRSR